MLGDDLDTAGLRFDAGSGGSRVVQTTGRSWEGVGVCSAPVHCDLDTGAGAGHGMTHWSRLRFGECAEQLGPGHTRGQLGLSEGRRSAAAGDADTTLRGRMKVLRRAVRSSRAHLVVTRL